MSSPLNKITATTVPLVYTLSLHDALPISFKRFRTASRQTRHVRHLQKYLDVPVGERRSEEHTSELQSRRDLVCRLLLEKKKTSRTIPEAPAPRCSAPSSCRRCTSRAIRDS